MVCIIFFYILYCLSLSLDIVDDGTRVFFEPHFDIKEYYTYSLIVCQKNSNPHLKNNIEKIEHIIKFNSQFYVNFSTENFDLSEKDYYVIIKNVHHDIEKIYNVDDFIMDYDFRSRIETYIWQIRKFN